MIKTFIFIVVFLTCLQLQSYFPSNFFGQAVNGPVTKYEESIVHLFGTYHQETRYKFEAERLNSLDENFKIIRKKIYSCYPWDDFALEFNDGNEYEYDTVGKLKFVNEIDGDNNFIEVLQEYTYHYQNLDKVTTSNNWLFDYRPQSVYVTYYNFQEEIRTNRLITYIYGQNGLTKGWTGRNYDFYSDYLAIGSFAYDEEQRIIWLRYETPASKEHVVVEGTFTYDEDKLVGIDYGRNHHQFEYDEFSRILEINVYNSIYGNIVQSYYYDYDEYGRMILETVEYFFSDGTLEKMHVYEYEYSAFVTDVISEVIENRTALLNNYPNPFNPTTTIKFSIEQEQEVDMSIYNIKGQKIRTLLSENRQAGTHHIDWDGTDINGKPVSSGIYLYHLKTESQTLTKRMLLLK